MVTGLLAGLALGFVAAQVRPIWLLHARTLRTVDGLAGRSSSRAASAW